MKNFCSGRLIVSSTEKSADLLYAGGFNAPDDFVYFETPEKRAIVVSTLELSRAMTEAKDGVQVINRYDILHALPEAEQASAGFYVALSRYAGVDHWQVPADFPLAYADQMRNAGIRVECVSGDFFPQRAVKDEWELQEIRKSMQITENAMMLVQSMIADASVNSHGILELQQKILTCDDIRMEVECYFKRHGFTARQTIIACGSDAAAPHNIGRGPVYANETIVADIFPRNDVSGYWGDMTRTFCKGSASPMARKAFEAVRQVSENVLKHLKAGIPGVLLHQIAAKTMEEAGFMTGLDQNGKPCGFIHSLGHGVGLDIHEQPRLAVANTRPLPENAVVSVEPGLYYFEWGGIRLEDLVIVKNNGCENLCSMPKELEIP